jgi:ABC-type transport system substrate-binding protein
MQAETVKAQDFVRAIERALSPLPPWLTNRTLGGPYLDNFFALYLHAVDVIVGAKAYGEGKAQHISGLETPDDYTLVVHLTHPSGEFGYAMAVPELAPIPPVPSHPEWPWGTAQGHEGTYFSYLVSTGPYMIAGAPQLDFSKPPQEQLPVSGDAPDGFTLVRNPSWRQATDPLRPALPDRIEYVPVKDPRTARRLMAKGAIDFPLGWPTPPRLLSRSNGPVSSAGSFVFLFLNLAMKPLNDVHVRRAIAFAIRRQRFVANLRKLDHISAVPATHMGFNDQENNLLLNYDPYRASTGDLKAAWREMAKSRYDSNHDGRCDGPVCHFPFLDTPGFHDQALDKGLARDLKRIGLDVHVHITTRDLNDPKVHDPMVVYGWSKNSVGASTFFNLAFGGPPFRTTGAELLNFSHVGARPAELKSWGFHITHVPSLDDKLGRCLALTFSEQTQCYAELDQFITTRLVPTVPLAWPVEGRLISKRVARFNFDPFPVTPLPSLDRIVLRPDTKLAPMPHHTHPVPPIPQGMYRFKLSRADVLRFDPHATSTVIQNETGVVTVNLRNGLFSYLTYAPRPMDSPMAVGIYKGHGHEVSFQIQRPAPGSVLVGLDGSGVFRVPAARWQFDGDALHFKLQDCGKLSRTQCEGIRAIYEAHPWVKVAHLP